MLFGKGVVSDRTLSGELSFSVRHNTLAGQGRRGWAQDCLLGTAAAIMEKRHLVDLVEVS